MGNHSLVQIHSRDANAKWVYHGRVLVPWGRLAKAERSRVQPDGERIYSVCKCVRWVCKMVSANKDMYFEITYERNLLHSFRS